MKTTALYAALLAAAFAAPAALACPADTSLEHGPAATSVPHRHAASDAPRACPVHVAGNPKMTRTRGRAVSCPEASARPLAGSRDAA